MLLHPSILNWMAVTIGSGLSFWRYILLQEKKMGYINRKKVALAEDDPSYDEWEAKDALVKSGLLIQ